MARSLGHGPSSINFIVWMQPAVTGSRRFCVCAPSPATVSLSLATRERPRCRGCAKKRQSQLASVAWPFLSMLISGMETLIRNNCAQLMSREHICKIARLDAHARA
jgi:hypothetical protein